MKRVAILIDEGFEDSEFIYPYYRLLEAGMTVTVIAPKTGSCMGKHGTKAKVTEKLETAQSEAFDALYLPGGLAPEKLQKVAETAPFVRSFAGEQKLICAVCHGPLLLASAGLLKGKKVTAYPSVKEALVEAGADYTGSGAEKDGKIITARDPQALPEMMRLFLAQLES